ncbi:MAG: AlpA family phage regulatory protein [Acidithiobacillus sp.]|nr:AlpA family phage regulatory protein [Acidithiobacillus sp.]
MERIVPMSLKQVVQATTLSKSTVYALIKAGKFPRPRKLLGSRTVWLEHEVQDWLKAQLAGGEQ